MGPSRDGTDRRLSMHPPRPTGPLWRRCASARSATKKKKKTCTVCATLPHGLGSISSMWRRARWMKIRSSRMARSIRWRDSEDVCLNIAGPNSGSGKAVGSGLYMQGDAIVQWSPTQTQCFRPGRGPNLQARAQRTHLHCLISVAVSDLDLARSILCGA